MTVNATKTMQSEDAERIDAGKDVQKAGQNSSEPEKLGEELPAVPAFDAGPLVPGSLRPMVEDVADRMKVPLVSRQSFVWPSWQGFAGVGHLFSPRKKMTRGWLCRILGSDHCATRHDEKPRNRFSDRASACAGGRVADRLCGSPTRV